MWRSTTGSTTYWTQHMASVDRLVRGYSTHANRPGQTTEAQWSLCICCAHYQLRSEVEKSMFRHLVLLAVVPVTAIAGSDESFTGEGTSYTLGQVSGGNCNFMHDPGVGENYAALNNEQWESTRNCGRCAKVSCDDPRCSDTTATELVYIVDRCPECKFGDLDLSPTVFKKLTGSDPSRYKMKWKFVDCPVQGSIKYCTKSGSSSSWLAIQPANFVTGVASFKIANQDVTMVDSCYYYLLAGGANVDMSAVNVELTSISGETITETLKLTADSCTDGTSNFGTSTTQQQDTEVSAPPPATTPPPASFTPPYATPTPTPQSNTPQSGANGAFDSLRSSASGSDYKVGLVSPIDQSEGKTDLSTLQQSESKTPETQSQLELLGSAEYNAGTVLTAREIPPSTPLSYDSSSRSIQEQETEAGGSTDPTNYKAGKVLVPEEGGTDVSILQADQSDVEKTHQDGEGAQMVNTKSAAEPNGTSPLIVALIVLTVVGVIVLAAIVYVIKKKQLMDKQIDRDEALIRAFDSYSSPVEINTSNIARI